PAMLEELARDVTGWPVHVVEMLELLAWTQHVNHLRPLAGFADVRSVERMDRLDGAWDDVAHTADVRPIGQLEGREGIHKVGFFAWRLRSFPLDRVPARRSGTPWRFHASPLGNDAPLFMRR